MKVSFGLDLAGYSSGRTTLARLIMDGEESVRADIFSVPHLTRKLLRNGDLKALVDEERALISACLEIGPLAVDVPIDLQGLPDPYDAKWPWQLTMRPVDYAFDALSPLADRIGAPVARFRNVLRGIDSAGRLLGERLFETYPAACLDRLNIPKSPYKGSFATFEGGAWTGAFIKKGQTAKTSCIALIANQLGLSGEPPLTLTDDELDSVICALACIDIAGSSLAGPQLASIIGEKVSANTLGPPNSLHFDPPRGYVILDSAPSAGVQVRRRSLNSLGDLRPAEESGRMTSV